MDRELTVMGARMELGDQERRLLGSPRRKLMVTSAQVWATEGEGGWHLEHSLPRTCWPIQCVRGEKERHQNSPKLVHHIGSHMCINIFWKDTQEAVGKQMRGLWILGVRYVATFGLCHWNLVTGVFFYNN